MTFMYMLHKHRNGIKGGEVEEKREGVADCLDKRYNHSTLTLRCSQHFSPDPVSSSGTPNKVRHLVLNDMPLLTEIRADDLAAFSNLVSLSISGSTVRTLV